MAQPDEKRELSGLARSIDALFTHPPRAVPVDATLEPGDAVPSSDERPRSPEQPVEPDEPDEADVPPSRDEPADPWEESAAEPEPNWSAQARTGEFDTLAWEIDEEERAPEGQPVEAPPRETELPQTHLGEADAPEVGARGDAPPSTPAPVGLERAVDEFLAGAPGAAAEVRELAAELQDRLALDPLADAVERLVREAGDPPDPTLVEMAEDIIDPAVASRIVQRIGHERDEERLAAYVTLCRLLGDIMAKAFRGALTGATGAEVRRRYHDMLIAMSDTCRPIIEEMVEDENSLLVCSGIAVLGEIGGERSVDLVTSGLAHPDKRVRAQALLSLPKLGDGKSGVLVTGFLEDPEEDVRVAAATAAGELRIERALKPLLGQLEAEGDGDGALPYIDALGKLGDPGAVPTLEKLAVRTLFSKPRPEIRVAAYRALHRIGTPHARELVQKALDDKEPGVRAAVRRLVDTEPDA